MPTIKSKTVNGKTIELKEYDGEYHVAIDGAQQTDPVYTEQRAKQAFDGMVEAYGGPKAENQPRQYGQGTVDEAFDF